MGKKSSTAPAAPDPAATAAAQATANKETAIANANINMVDQITPYGDLKFSERGEASDGTPQYTATQTLAPDQQRQLDLTNQAGIKYGETANAQLGNVSEKLSAPLSFDHLGAAPTINEDTRQSVRDSMMGRLNEDFARDEDSLRTRLVNQGLNVGTEAYDREFDLLNRGKNDARLAVDNQALSQAGQLYGLESSARNSAINELSMARQQPLNELAAMLSGSQVQGPQFVNTPQTNMAAPDLLGATYASHNSALNNYNQGQANNNAMMGGLFGLGGSILSGGSMPGGFLGF